MMLDRLGTFVVFAVVMLGVSLLITVATQFISGALGLRGSNLLWGIERILESNGIENKNIARQVLTHPSISDSIFSTLTRQLPAVDWLVCRWRLATAIRPDELSRILGEIAQETAPAEHQAKRKAKGVPQLDHATRETINRALSAVDEVVLGKLKSVHEGVANATSNWTAAMDRVLQQVTESTRQPVMKLDASFAMVMDRVAQRFAMKMRCITVVVAFVVAFSVHLDSLKLLEQLATHPDQRSALVSMHDAVLKQARSLDVVARRDAPLADAVIAPSPVVDPAILTQAMDNLRKTAGEVTLAPAPEFASYAEAANWLKTNGQGALEPRYRLAVLAALEQRATEIQQRLARSDFRLISPSPYRLLPLFDGWRNLLGLLITAVFLSLGAPFWFNALKGLSSLRTVLADNEKKETGKA
jgi:hypothetical protein